MNLSACSACTGIVYFYLMSEKTEFLTSKKILPAYFRIESFKKKIIYRIIASVKYFIARRDVKNAEAGLITIFNVIGFISSEFIGVKKLEFTFQYSYAFYRFFFHS